MNTFLQDHMFLEQLVNYKVQHKYIKIDLLNENEIPISSIEGRCTGGSINVNNSSPMRRTGQITFIANEKEGYDLKDIDNLLSINKRIQVYVGIQNFINEKYEDIIWFLQGTFVIEDPSITHSSQGVLINLNLKDKMCLLNGECGGGLPACVTYNKYDQYDENGNKTEIENPIYDIIYTLVHNYGGIPLDKIFINGLDRRLKQLCRYEGTKPLYFQLSTGIYTFQKPAGFDNDQRIKDDWTKFESGQEIGYRYVDFVYPDSKNGLTSGIGDNVCSVLNKLIERIGNYQYFFDVYGNFIFQEKINYLNTSYEAAKVTSDNGYIIGDTNYEVDFSNHSPAIYTFSQENALISSYQNSIGYTTIKNDYHIWGKITNEETAFHYHLAIKEKPKKMGTYIDKGMETEYYNLYYIIPIEDEKGKPTGRIRLADIDQDGNYEPGSVPYYTIDWRAELYMQGLQDVQRQLRPDRIKQELLDLFDDIYNMYERKYRVNDLQVNNLKYWIDFLEPYNQFTTYSVDNLNLKTMSYQSEGIRKLFDTPDIPNLILLCPGNEEYPIHEEERYKNFNETDGYEVLRRKCEEIGQPFSNISPSLLSLIIPNVIGYSAQETARNLLYQHTDYAEQINITTIPIYYLDVNNTITVRDKDSNIDGDYVIDTISIPLDTSQMNISATKALRRL